MTAGALTEATVHSQFRAAPAFRSRRRLLSPGWPLYALLYGFPVWWALGMQAFVWPIVSFLALAHLIRRRQVRVPRGFGIFLLFLAWMLISSLQLNSSKQLLSFSYRGSLYISAAILLLYLFNVGQELLPTKRIVYAVTFLWFVTVLGGFAGILAPHVQFRSLVELLLPAHIVANPFIKSLVHPGFADTSTLLGYALARPKAPFNYTNEWGSNLAILTPFAVYSLHFVKHRLWRWVIVLMLVLSSAPIVMSINRGLWISLSVGVLYVVFRLGLRGKLKPLGATLLLVTIALITIVFTPLGQVVIGRLEHPNTSGRAYLYQQATDSALQSPILGHGAPLPSGQTGIAQGASIGTHGQLWTILVSQGFPGLVLFVGFFVAMFLMTWRVSMWVLWPHAAILIALSQLAVYNMLPVQIHLVGIAVLLCWRDVTAALTSGGPARGRRISHSLLGRQLGGVT